MSLIRGVDLLFRAIEFLIVLRAFMTWLPGATHSLAYKFIYQITEPILAPFRRFVFNYFDFSPLLALFAIDIVKNLVIMILVRALY
ncbi:MAG: YggT family protein [Thermosediminibacteraceae bacterium]|nr:YggT family protein [Thermosediminibacteraceae bacterium]